MMTQTLVSAFLLAVFSVIPSFLIGGVLMLVHGAINIEQTKTKRHREVKFSFIYELLEDGAHLDEGMAFKRGKCLLKTASALRLYNFVVAIILACFLAGFFSYVFIDGLAWRFAALPYVVATICAVLVGLKCVEVLRKSRTYLALKYAKGRALDWDDKTIVNGIEILARFDQHPHAVPLALHNGTQRISSDNITYKINHISAKPDITHRHFNCNLVIEFKSLSGSSVKVTSENWKSTIRLKDVLQLLASAAVVSKCTQNAPVGALLLYPGVTLFVRPLQDHVQWLFNFAYQKSMEQNVPMVSASDLAHSAEGPFTQHFTDASVCGIVAHETLINSPVIRL